MSLLLKLLQYKYQKQKSVRVNPQIIHLAKGEKFSSLIFSSSSSEDRPIPSFVAYELTLVVVHYETSLLTTLVVRRLDDSLPLIVFTVDGNQEEEEEEGFVRYVLNNRYMPNMDNGYFVFDFLDRLFKDDLLDTNDDVTLLYPSNQLTNTKILAQTIINDVTRYLRVKQNIVRLYKTLDRLLLEIRDDIDDSGATRVRLRLAVEHNKQLLYKWIDCVIEDEQQCPSSSSSEIVPANLVFFTIHDIVHANDDDNEWSGPATTTSEDLLKELVALIQYQIRVVNTGDRAHATGVSILKGDVEEDELQQQLNVTQVKRRIERLRYLLIGRIDALNIPDDSIDLDMSDELGFTQIDYTILVEQQFLPYAIMARYLKGHLHPETRLMGPPEALSAQDIEGLNTSARIIFWVLEQFSEGEDNKRYSALMLLHYPLAVASWQRSLYAPSSNEADVDVILDIADTLLEQTGLTSYRRQFDSHYDSNTSDYLYTSWYTLLIIKAISDRLVKHHEPLEDDWIEEVDKIIKSISLDEINDTIETLLYKMRALILDLFVRESKKQPPQPQRGASQIIELDSDDDDDEDDDRPEAINLHSNVSDLAKLSMTSQYIDDNPIIDMIATMDKDQTCYLFDPTYWGNMMILGFEKTLRKNKVFDDPDISLILMPLNQDNTHWSLAIIDPVNHYIGYYSSIENDAYFKSTFEPRITEYMAFQTPDIEEYVISREEGPTQAVDCYDCALFMLNRLSGECAKVVLKYTRASVIKSIRQRLLLLTTGDDKWRRYANDFYNYYLSIPEAWKDISEDPLSLVEYRENYLDVLRGILSSTKLFTDDSIDSLIEKLEELVYVKSPNDVALLFINTLVSRDITKRRRRKRQEEAEEQPIKLRKCLVYDKGTAELITQLVNQLELLKRWPVAITKEEFIKMYKEYVHTKLLAPLVTDIDTREAFFDELVNTLFDTSANDDVTLIRERIVQVIEAFVECRKEERQVMKCFYCTLLTSFIDLKSMRAQCCKDCQ